MELTFLRKIIKSRKEFFCLALMLCSFLASGIAQENPVLVYDNESKMGNNSVVTAPSQRWIHGQVLAPKEFRQLSNTASGRTVNKCGNIAVDVRGVLNNPVTGMIKVNYTGFTPEAQAAFQYAVDIWSRVLNLSVPIEIDANFAPLAPGVLGQAGPSGFFRFSNNIVYPSALSDQFVGRDLRGVDMNMTFSSTFPFYLGLDGCPSSNQFDFTTIVLHEIGHGLGFLSSDFTFAANSVPRLFGANHPAGACVGFSGSGGMPTPYIFDLFLRSTSFGGTPYQALSGLTPFPGTFGANNTPLADLGCYQGLDQYFLRNDLDYTGPNLQGCLGGPAKIFAPNPYQSGSSISHFDEATYPGVHPNALLTPFVAPGQAVHDPGCALSVLDDIGYSVKDLRPGDIRAIAGAGDPIPTMNEWGLMIFGLLILNLSVLFIRRREEVIA